MEQKLNHSLGKIIVHDEDEGPNVNECRERQYEIGYKWSVIGDKCVLDRIVKTRQVVCVCLAGWRRDEVVVLRETYKAACHFEVLRDWQVEEAHKDNSQMACNNASSF